MTHTGLKHENTAETPRMEVLCSLLGGQMWIKSHAHKQNFLSPSKN